MKRLTTFILVGAMAFAMTQTGVAQLLKNRGEARVNTEFIPDSAFACAVMFPRRIAADPKFDLFPREIVSAWGTKELGFDPMLIKQATFVLEGIQSLERPPRWAAVLHFDEMQGLAGGLIDQLQEKKVNGKAMFSGAAMGMPSFLIYDEATLFIGDEAMFQSMVSADQSNDLVKLVKGASVKGEVRAYGRFEEVRPLLHQLMAGIPALLPPAITNAVRLIRECLLWWKIGSRPCHFL